MPSSSVRTTMRRLFVYLVKELCKSTRFSSVESLDSCLSWAVEFFLMLGMSGSMDQRTGTSLIDDDAAFYLGVLIFE